jgi:hypothetical protein
VLDARFHTGGVAGLGGALRASGGDGLALWILRLLGAWRLTLTRLPGPLWLIGVVSPLSTAAAA